MKYFSTKQFGPISTGHRQWRDLGHCKFLHGYGRYVELTFKAAELDDKGWVMDFGNLQDVKSNIESNWDHRMLIASDDPEYDWIMLMDEKGILDVNVMDQKKGHGPGIEQSCKFIYDLVTPILNEKTGGRVTLSRVRIWEHQNNSAILEVE